MKKLLPYTFLLLTVYAFAQQQYAFTNYTQEQGLPSATIRGIYKDTTGYIWFTSEGSLARFDGYTYRTYRSNPATESLRSPFGGSGEIISVNEAKGVKDCYSLKRQDNIYSICKTDIKVLRFPWPGQ